jgi:tripartite-type tricarboxylate transporter receptor subunit TctC
MNRTGGYPRLDRGGTTPPTTCGRERKDRCVAACRLTRRSWLAGLAASTLGPSLAWGEPAYPAGRTIKVVVGYPPGGSSDIVGRLVADRLGAMWGVPLVVENVAGANGNIGSERVAKGPADGTQLLVVTTSLATNAYLYSKLSYDPERDIKPVSCVARLPNLLLVKTGLPVSSVAELIAYAKPIRANSTTLRQEWAPVPTCRPRSSSA